MNTDIRAQYIIDHKSFNNYIIYLNNKQNSNMTRTDVLNHLYYKDKYYYLNIKKFKKSIDIKLNKY